jgi:hypothetical protein
MQEKASVISKEAGSGAPYAVDSMRIRAQVLLPSLLFSEYEAEAKFQTQNERNTMNQFVKMYQRIIKM